MAIQISGTSVINNDKQLDTGLVSAYDTVSAAGSATVTNRTVYYVTSDAQTITLPSSPGIGNEVVIMVGNYTGVVIARNTKNIMGLAENLTIDKPYAGLTLIYVDATRGWVLC